MDAEDLKLSPAIVFRDSDRKYSAEFDDAFRKGGVEVKRNTPLSPNLRAHVERFIQSLKVECLGKFVLLGKRHLNHICRAFEVWYNTERPHEARGYLPPASGTPWNHQGPSNPGDVVRTPRPADRYVPIFPVAFLPAIDSSNPDATESHRGSQMILKSNQFPLRGGGKLLLDSAPIVFGQVPLLLTSM